MPHGPIGVVTQGVHRFDRHHWTFKGTHTVERQRDDEEAKNRVVTQFVPCARQSHDAVDHAAPAWRQQDQGKHHADGLGPIGQSGVMQVVRTRPHVGKDQCPKVNDG